MVAIRFRETMRGWAEIGGERRDFSFTVQVTSSRLIMALGPCRLQGTVSLEGLCHDSPIEEGVMDMGLPLRRRIGYDFSFRDQGGALCRFSGEKTVRYLRMARTMTTLKGQVRRGDEVLGPAELRFKLSELPAFLATFRLASSRRADPSRV